MYQYYLLNTYLSILYAIARSIMIIVTLFLIISVLFTVGSNSDRNDKDSEHKHSPQYNVDNATLVAKGFHNILYSKVLSFLINEIYYK